jgi:uncharacterized protein involved in exopolysaccharide biosynthesis
MDDDWEDSESSGGGGPFAEILRDPLGVIRRHWKPMVALTVAGLVVTGLVTALQKPQYYARATVLIASQKLSEEFVRPTIAEDVLERVNAMTAEALSREKLTTVVQKYDLFSEVREERGMADAVAVLRSKVEIEADKAPVASRNARALVLAIGYTGSEAQGAADVANEVARLFTDAGVRLRTQQAQLTTEFLRRELETAETALTEQKREISEFQQQHRGELPSELESNLRRLERLQQQRNSLALQITDAETRMALAAASGGSPNPAMVRLRELEGQLARELGVNKETHPNVQSLRRQIAAARAQAGGGGGEGSGVLVGASRREVTLLREQLAETDLELERLDAAVAAIPIRQEQLSGMLERMSVLQENYLDFLRKVNESELAQSLEMAQQGDRVAVLDAASPPNSPINAAWKFLLGGLVGSIGLALGAGLLLELRDPVVVSVSGLEAATGVPVLGSVPRMV